jgi:uncharacterized protein YndB with AHSA1/START domain
MRSSREAIALAFPGRPRAKPERAFTPCGECGMIRAVRDEGGGMAPMVHSVEIDRRCEDVFAYVTDPTRFPEWQDAVVRASPQGSGPLQQGSRISLTRRMGKREQTMTSELTEYSPPESYAFRVLDGPVRAIGKGRFEPLGEGDRTRFTFELDFEGHGVGKLLVPLFVRRQAAKELPESHVNLKRRLEGGA